MLWKVRESVSSVSIADRSLRSKDRCLASTRHRYNTERLPAPATERPYRPRCRSVWSLFDIEVAYSSKQRSLKFAFILLNEILIVPLVVPSAPPQGLRIVTVPPS